MATAILAALPPTTVSRVTEILKQRTKYACSHLILLNVYPSFSSSSCIFRGTPSPHLSSNDNYHGRRTSHHCYVVACLSFSSSSASSKLYVSGLSFRTTKESLRNAFQKFGQLVEVNLEMDKIANRPRGFAFLHYATEEDAKKAIEGMHGKLIFFIPWSTEGIHLVLLWGSEITIMLIPYLTINRGIYFGKKLYLSDYQW